MFYTSLYILTYVFSAYRVPGKGTGVHDRLSPLGVPMSQIRGGVKLLRRGKSFALCYESKAIGKRSAIVWLTLPRKDEL
jgi:hypothetical protein